MKKMILKLTASLFSKLSIEITRLWLSPFNISVMRKLNKIQLSDDQLIVISEKIKKQIPCRLLIFGLGNDSLFWHKLNQRGVTIFLEDNKYWFHKITKSSKDLVTLLVDYNTHRNQWKMLLESPSLLDMNLPNIVKNVKWDVIFVDAPNGYDDHTPGRMKSIFMSARLVKDSGDVFVHDCDREVENIYTNQFLKKENLKKEIQATIGFLRYYHIEKI